MEVFTKKKKATEIVPLGVTISVLETPGIPVTGTPSLYLAFYSIFITGEP